jgi:type IV secretory pathway TraG/TraD family ATPase VirD4
LASEFARAKTTENYQNETNISEDSKNKQILFENILKNVKEKVTQNLTSINITREEIDKTLVYFTSQWINMPSKTRESVYTVFRSKIDIFSTGFIAKLLFSDISNDNSNYFQIKNTRNGKIIILDTPVSTEKEEGRIFQETIKSIWQNEIIASAEGLPCILISDEFQQFAFESDVEFLSINRSYNLAMILATQNYTCLVDKLGEVKTKRLLGNIQTKFFFQTSDKNTWQFARELMGEVDSNSYTEQYNQSTSGSISSSQKYELLGEHFQQLGMKLPKSQAEAIVFKKGYLFNENKKKYLHVIFDKIEEVKDGFDYKVRANNNSNDAEYFDVKKAVNEMLKSGKKDTNINHDKLNIQQAVVQNTSDSNPLNFININEAMNRYKKSESLIRKKISGLNLEIKLEKQASGKTQKLYSQAQLDELFNHEKVVTFNEFSP